MLIFGVGLFLLGLGGLLRPPFFYLYPLVLGAIGFRGLGRDLGARGGTSGRRGCGSIARRPFC